MWIMSGKWEKCVSEAPVLQYYDIRKPVTIQADASQYGLGATLLQDNLPVCFASRALSSTRSLSFRKE